MRIRIFGRAQELSPAQVAKLWNSKIRSCDDLEPLSQEVSKTERIFEGCERDLENIQGMRRILRIYQDCYSRLDDKNLSWKRFESLVGTLKSEAEKDYGDEDPPAWDIHETLELFAREISNECNQNKTKLLIFINCLNQFL